MFWNAIVAALCMCGIGGPVEGPYQPADRLTPPPPVTAPVDPCVAAQQLADGLVYTWGNLDPVRTAYRAVAGGCMGWTPAQITRWEAFIVDDVIKEESGGCWNVLRGGRWTGTGCQFTYPNGSHEDAGFFQLIGIWHGYPDGYLCRTFGTCGRSAVIASPWSSMISGLRAIEHDGSRPWCYSASARSFHRGCASVPRNFG